ncbi:MULTISPECIES: TMEM165/GDT1 family protein [Mycolicibacterium]|uniref:GDT1 family protein n=1 Tax=Mycolicibacterium austroafricanum TaxID=39687 RepID=A0ABT8HN14_MYCAO|nr:MULTISPECIES: TMEM165/GDT1 family protein [Mycolicibacterium]MDN4522150.1 TMEM165/GDT1 family protein [Mycolicibacterium austroafricanum]QRZ05744.1 TMEM165/GDT1 family protein [Mycolicibacterium austroafricanum]QZT67299.1 TMEM165/GDT1 family protein [Mycolicibacterium austroafricanum]QZY45062.1 TMEM165/GDT1 family protein [Mycolicibacterium austroafricanum]UJL28817.1 TMEM165/GDT1 family protein [Mycolicibacterium vanbaalenii]
MLAALLLSFAVIFVAELGDKTQLVAMMFALRYRWWVVLSAITAATAVVHVLSVAIGYYLGAALPTHLLGFIAGAMFIFFGLWTLRGDSLTDEETSRAAKATAPAFFVVTSAFVLAELGDKTMLATVTLAADRDWLGVWIGSTLGMVAADGLAILVGAVAGKHLPERLIQISAAALFLLFGFYMVFDNLLPTAPTAAVAGAASTLVLILGGVMRALPDRLRPAVLRPSAPSAVDIAERDECSPDAAIGSGAGRSAAPSDGRD